MRKIWITGASSGIGKALAIKFANEGWKVAISAIFILIFFTKKCLK
jgi:NAD(P)-dependent dehydrogenase (short-subunit alcohol dehydrogenase family)